MTNKDEEPLRVELPKKDRAAIASFLESFGDAEDGGAESTLPPPPDLALPLPPSCGDNTKALQTELARLRAAPPYARMLKSRSMLPAYEQREAVLDAIRGAFVTVVRGETGCGKSTQLPQLLLEDCAARGLPFRGVVTQPRRLAAMALAARVAEEQGDGSGLGGLVVGYRVRGEARARADTALTFLTTGLLLRRLEGARGGVAAGLAGLTHVIVDEVHERSVETDLLLLVLRRAAAAAAAAGGAALVALPRIVLMSATVEAGPLVDYFAAVAAVAPPPPSPQRGSSSSCSPSAPSTLPKGGGVTTVHIPGRTFPVKERYLEVRGGAAQVGR